MKNTNTVEIFLNDEWVTISREEYDAKYAGNPEDPDAYDAWDFD